MDKRSAEGICQALDNATGAECGICEAYCVSDGLPCLKRQHNAREPHSFQSFKWVEEAVFPRVRWYALPVECRLVGSIGVVLVSVRSHQDLHGLVECDCPLVEWVEKVLVVDVVLESVVWEWRSDCDGQANPPLWIVNDG